MLPSHLSPGLPSKFQQQGRRITEPKSEERTARPGKTISVFPISRSPPQAPLPLPLCRLLLSTSKIPGPAFHGGGGAMRPPAEAHQSRLLYELCACLLTILRPPEEGALARPWQVSAAGVASMLLGASMALMLCGSVTFMLGFFLMPCVIGLACVFLFVGFVTNLSGIGRAILWPAAACSSSPKGASTWHIFSKPPFMQM